ncbi:hypothetical protein F4781DRAFT_97660 [Annulohypoxylon bovei var. microspora]|nr:hypothetical protein F4781DRAFT_97660 [Annulohypoxylon bovei var. microspora]
MSLSKPTQQRAVIGERLSELTTVFSPPCPITWLLTTTKVPSQYPAFPTTGPSSCDPPSWVDNISQKGFAYYSPAICPSGFFAGCTVNDDRIGEGFPATSAGETAMYCVPSGFACTSDTTDFRGGIWGFRTASAGSPSVTVGPALQIRWREEDLSSLQTDPLNPGAAVSVVISSLAGTVTPTAEPVIITPATSSSTFATSTLPISTLPTSTQVDTEGFPTNPTTSTATEVSTNKQPSSSPSRLDTTASIQAGSTSTAGDGNAPSSSPNQDGSTSVASSTTTAATALSGILIVMILGFLATVTFRRYRRYRAGKIEAFFPFRTRLWAKAVLDKWTGRSIPSNNLGDLPPKIPDAELGTDGPIPELGPGDPLGTKDNPAELAGSGVRNSWMSHVSRIFTGRSRKEAWPV